MEKINEKNETKWFSIPNHPNYLINVLGEVKAVYKNGKTKILKPQPIGRDYQYRYYALDTDGIRKQYYVHQLMAIVFLGHIISGHKGKVVDHVNSDKTDNRLCNLQLLTNADNIRKSRAERLQK